MRSIKNQRLWSLLAIVAAAGCATAPQKVVPLGQDAFRVSVSAPSFARQADTNYKAFDAASTFCGQKGEQVLFRESQESGVHSWSPKREDLTFVCTRIEDAGALHASLR
jgi:putative hemolysin